MNEKLRLELLRKYDVRSSSDQAQFDEITSLTADIFKAEIALISIVEQKIQWFKSRVGLQIGESKRENSFCNYAIQGTDVFVVEDTFKDERFCNHEFVKNSPHIRFYAGAVLKVAEGENLGTLCIIDSKPRTFSQQDKEHLSILSRQVISRLEKGVLETKVNKVLQNISNLIENIPATMALLDRNFCYVAVSSQWIKDYAIDSTIIGKSYYDVFPDVSESWRKIHRQALAGETLSGQNENYVRADGTLEWLNWDVRPWYEDNGSIGGIIILTEIITEKKQTENALQSAKEEASRSSRAKSVFLANMSHEIRTPLNSILGLSDLLSQTSLEEEQKNQIQIIQRSGEVLLSLINNVLDLSRIESGSMSLESSRFSLLDLVSNVVNMFHYQAKEKNLRLHSFVDQKLAKFIGDPGRIVQILINVLGNAVKFTNSGSVAIFVEPNKTGHKGNVLITIRDTGVGIEDSKQHEIFDNFNQGEDANIRNFGGSGLGLAITKNLVDLMDGEIWFNSQQGKGSSFFISLSLQSDNSEFLKTENEDSLLNQRLRILIVDDSPENRGLIQAYFKKYPFEISMATNGAEALEMMESNVYDIVFMDMQMPIMDGMTATREYRHWESLHHRKLVPIIALSAFALQEEIDKSLEAGCSMHLSKPVKKSVILEAMRRIGLQNS